jgi:hypothetical protein
MSALGSLKMGLSRLFGLLFILAGAAALTVGYFGWKEASNPTVTMLPPTPPAAARAAAAKPASRTAVSITPTAKGIGAKRAKVAPPAKAASATAAAAAAPASPVRLDRVAFWRRTMAWSGAALALGLAFVGYSLHDRPKIIRSGADEMLNEPLPF